MGREPWSRRSEVEPDLLRQSGKRVRDRGFERQRGVEGRHRSEGEGRRYALAGGGKREGGRATLQL